MKKRNVVITAIICGAVLYFYQGDNEHLKKAAETVRYVVDKSNASQYAHLAMKYLREDFSTDFIKIVKEGKIIIDKLGADTAPKSFSEAKQLALTAHTGKETTFYCGCEWKAVKKQNGYYTAQLNTRSCGYTPRKDAQRGSRLEWEHVMPISDIGRSMQCWQNGGRKNCNKVSPEFNRIEADLHNLVPAIGEINQDRSNFRYGEIPGEKRFYGACNAEVDFKQRVFEPADNIKGDVARIYRYMSETYGVPIGDKQNRLFRAWEKLDPVSPEECARNQRNKNIMGRGNRFVEVHC